MALLPKLISVKLLFNSNPAAISIPPSSFITLSPLLYISYNLLRFKFFNVVFTFKASPNSEAPPGRIPLKDISKALSVLFVFKDSAIALPPSSSMLLSSIDHTIIKYL